MFIAKRFLRSSICPKFPANPTPYKFKTPAYYFSQEEKPTVDDPQYESSKNFHSKVFSLAAIGHPLSLAGSLAFNIFNLGPSSAFTLATIGVTFGYMGMVESDRNSVYPFLNPTDGKYDPVSRYPRSVIANASIIPLFAYCLGVFNPTALLTAAGLTFTQFGAASLYSSYTSENSFRPWKAWTVGGLSSLSVYSIGTFLLYSDPLLLSSGVTASGLYLLFLNAYSAWITSSASKKFQEGERSPHLVLLKHYEKISPISETIITALLFAGYGWIYLIPIGLTIYIGKLIYESTQAKEQKEKYGHSLDY